MKSILSALAFAFILFVSAPSFAASDTRNIVGEILEVEGTGTISNSAGQIYDAVVNSKVHPTDVISTGPGSRIFIQFIDNTEFTLSENAQFTVDEYSFDENDKSKNYATYSVLRGAFLYVSGLVAKKDEPDVKVNVPLGSIGIRGTKFWGGMIDGKYGVIVGEGKVNVRNRAGSVNLVRGQGTSLTTRDAKPADPTLWEQAKIAAATQTVTLQKPEEIGVRMAQARTAQPILREQHKAVIATIKREPAEVLEKRIEERMLKILPDKPEVTSETETKVEATVEPTTNLSLRERLEQKQLNATTTTTTDPVRTLSTLKTGDTTTRVIETVRPITGTVTETATQTPTRLIDTTTDVVKAGTETTKEIVTETTNTVGETGTRVIENTTEVTTTVKDVTTDTVKATTDVVKDVTETPVIKNTTDPVRETVKTTVTPATDALKNLRTQTLNK